MLETLDTERIYGRIATSDDEGSIRLVLEENLTVLQLLESKVDVARDARRIADNDDLPPGGKKENSYHYLLFARSNNEVAGILSCYLGYPEKEVFYVGGLFLRPRWQGIGLGKEIVSRVEDLLNNNIVKQIRLGVGLKNWSALRFWTGLGFDTITKIKGDSEFGVNQFAAVELLKRIG